MSKQLFYLSVIAEIEGKIQNIMSWIFVETPQDAEKALVDMAEMIIAEFKDQQVEILESSADPLLAGEDFINRSAVWAEFDGKKEQIVIEKNAYVEVE